MDILRETQHSQVFRLLAQELDGVWSVEALADHLSDLTDSILETTLEHCWHAYPKKHCDEPKFAIIAYGKLGGKEMGYASDLDLVFLYDDPHPDAAEIYSRFAQRLNNWLTTPTGAGTLFETDYRLRPNGESGLLVSSVSMFAQYQEKSAWFWELQALTRARFCAGDVSIGTWFEWFRAHLLSQARDPAWVRQEIVQMRDKIQAAHPNSSELFDVKYDAGGMIDIEFCVQALVLTYGQAYPELLENKGNIALLTRAARRGLITRDLAQQCGQAYRYFRQLQHDARLQNVQQTRVELKRVEESVQAVHQLRLQVLECS